MIVIFKTRIVQKLKLILFIHNLSLTERNFACWWAVGIDKTVLETCLNTIKITILSESYRILGFISLNDCKCHKCFIKCQ